VDVSDDATDPGADPWSLARGSDQPGLRDPGPEENGPHRRASLSTIPDREALRTRLTALWDYERFGVPVREGQEIFFERNSGLQNQSVLYVIDAPRFEPRELLDPNTLSSDGTVAVSKVVPSRDGSLLAYGLAVAAATGGNGTSGT
jgi:prolyl oligopeptidase